MYAHGCSHRRRTRPRRGMLAPRRVARKSRIDATGTVGVITPPTARPGVVVPPSPRPGQPAPDGGTMSDRKAQRRRAAPVLIALPSPPVREPLAVDAVRVLLEKVETLLARLREYTEAGRPFN